MVTPSAGSVVLVPFPFSDLTQSKLRPAVVLAEGDRGDWVLCQVTSSAYSYKGAIEIVQEDFLSGSLHRTSYARPGKLFTAHQSLMVSEVGVLKEEAFGPLVGAVVDLLQTSLTR